MKTDNAQRIDRAENALDLYFDDDETALIDLLADLLHWSASMGQDFDRALHSARMHFGAEA